MRSFLFCVCLATGLTAGAQEYQTLIHQGFQNYIATRQMDKLDYTLQELEQRQGKGNRYFDYWYAYACYKESILLNVSELPEKERKKQVGQTLSKGLAALDKIKAKTSEDYALMGVMTNFSLMFSHPLKIPFLSGEAKRYSQAAIDSDPENPRAYLSMGVHDLYTPERYGGGLIFEEQFLKAVSLPNSRSDNPHDPTWGRDDAYYYLIGHYLRHSPEKARPLVEQAMLDFPDDRRFPEFARQLP